MRRSPRTRPPRRAADACAARRCGLRRAERRRPGGGGLRASPSGAKGPSVSVTGSPTVRTVVSGATHGGRGYPPVRRTGVCVPGGRGRSTGRIGAPDHGRSPWVDRRWFGARDGGRGGESGTQGPRRRWKRWRSARRFGEDVDAMDDTTEALRCAAIGRRVVRMRSRRRPFGRRRRGRRGLRGGARFVASTRGGVRRVLACRAARASRLAIVGGVSPRGPTPGYIALSVPAIAAVRRSRASAPSSHRPRPRRRRAVARGTTPAASHSPHPARTDDADTGRVIVVPRVMASFLVGSIGPKGGVVIRRQRGGGERARGSRSGIAKVQLGVRSAAP